MNVSMGPASWVGFILTALSAVTLLIGELADAAEPLGVPPQTWAIVTAVIGVATILGRMAQAIFASLPNTDGAPEPPPTESTDVQV